MKQPSLSKRHLKDVIQEKEFLSGILLQAQKFMKSSDTNKISFTEIHQALPQIQCGRCDTPGCKEYAESIVEGAPINRCIPGGNMTLKKLQALTGNHDQTLDHSYGPSIAPQIALIIEDVCIGCAKCIPKCPVDAIIGAPGKLHQIDPDLCLSLIHI